MARLLPALTDFVVMVDPDSQMFITGPDVIKTVTARTSPWRNSRWPHPYGEIRNRALCRVRRAGRVRLRARAAELPAAQQLHRPPRYPAAVPKAGRGEPDRRGPRAGHADPDSPNQPYDMHEVVTRILDEDEFLEIQAATRRTSSSVRAHRGPAVGSSPTSHPVRRLPGHQRLGEARDSCGPATASTFHRDVRHVPASCPAPTRNTTHHPPRRQALYAYGEATVPEDHRHHPQGLRGAYCVMGSKDHGLRRQPGLADRADRVMGASGAVGFVYRQQLAQRPKTARTSTRCGFSCSRKRDTLVNPYIAAERGYVDAVIPPSYTRGYVGTALRLLERKIAQQPPKKHGNIPL
ncbi:putative propionyl-CoA carboxylase beta chain 5 [Mycobacterium kansasii]|uniref:Putative propionyl-CoA carboxylase beta chain 5 n=1 Tax=Mycobacterium kansasii TaxID=1768 RepID=A0A1V3WB06_MYCKA|nr:putative propionyl-CoA carboxylase beta chain 5 [Mycobacterium kansasii]